MSHCGVWLMQRGQGVLGTLYKADKGVCPSIDIELLQCSQDTRLSTWVPLIPESQGFTSSIAGLHNRPNPIFNKIIQRGVSRTE